MMRRILIRQFPIKKEVPTGMVRMPVLLVSGSVKVGAMPALVWTERGDPEQDGAESTVPTDTRQSCCRADCRSPSRSGGTRAHLTEEDEHHMIGPG